MDDKGGLILRLRPNEKFLVNGVVMENGDRRTRLRIRSENANILRFRDAIHPDEANTPAKRLYYIAQLAVVGEANPDEAKSQLVDGLNALNEAFGEESDCKQEIEQALTHAEEKRFYHVMRSLLRVTPHEAALLSVASINSLFEGDQKEA